MDDLRRLRRVGDHLRGAELRRPEVSPDPPECVDLHGHERSAGGCPKRAGDYLPHLYSGDLHHRPGGDSAGSADHAVDGALQRGVHARGGLRGGYAGHRVFGDAYGDYLPVHLRVSGGVDFYHRQPLAQNRASGGVLSRQLGAGGGGVSDYLSPGQLAAPAHSRMWNGAGGSVTGLGAYKKIPAESAVFIRRLTATVVFTAVVVLVFYPVM